MRGYPLLPHDIHVRGNVFTGTTATSAFDYIAPEFKGQPAKDLQESGNQFMP